MAIGLILSLFFFSSNRDGPKTGVDDKMHGI
jgi:hypothetical protein